MDTLNYWVKDAWLGALCRNNRYTHPTFLDGSRYVVMTRLLFTHAILEGNVFDDINVTQRWCYHTKEAALKALADWDGTGEPKGWHYHPSTGRRQGSDESEVAGFV